MAKDITFEIIEEYGIFRDEKKGWRGEVNLVSWNGNEPKIDIRTWNEDRSKSSKVACLTKEEAGILAEILYRI